MKHLEASASFTGGSAWVSKLTFSIEREQGESYKRFHERMTEIARETFTVLGGQAPSAIVITEENFFT